MVSCPLDEHHNLERRLEGKIEEFHTRLNEEKFAEIYNDANEELKTRQSEIDFNETLKSVKNKTGVIKKGGWVDLPSDYRRYVRLTVNKNEEKIEYKNILFCETGIGLEKFVFHVNNEKVEMISYELEKVGKKFKFTGKDGKEYVLGKD
jgi:hypothetical protein